MIFDADVELPDVSCVPVLTFAFGTEPPEQTEQTVRAPIGRSFSEYRLTFLRFML